VLRCFPQLQPFASVEYLCSIEHMSQDKPFYVVRERGYGVVVDTGDVAEALFVAMSVRQQKGLLQEGEKPSPVREMVNTDMLKNPQEFVKDYKKTRYWLTP
jgi:hypothetical protein